MRDLRVSSLSGLLGVSALLHRRDWSPDVRRHLRRLDHSMIFVLIAGTYTAIAGVVLDGVMRTVVLVAVWVGASGGVVFTVVWIDAPKWAAATRTSCSDGSRSSPRRSCSTASVS